MKKYWLIASLLLISSLSVLGQEQLVIDSLHRELKKQLADTSRIKTLLGISKCYSRSDSKKALEYIDEAKIIATKINAVKEWAHIYYYEGKVYYLAANYAKAIEDFEKALPIYLKLNNLNFSATIYLEMGTLLSETSDYKKALDNYSKALQLFKKSGLKKGEARCYGSMGVMYAKQKKYARSNEYMHKAIGLTSNKLDIATMYRIISQNYNEGGDYNKALSYFDSIVPALKEKIDFAGLSSAYLNFGKAYFALKNYKNARECYKISINYADQLGNQTDILYTQVSLSKLYIQVNQPDSAIILLKQGIELNKKPNILELSELLYRNISDAYEKKGDIKSAFAYYKKYKEICDTFAKQLSDEKLLDIQTKWEVDKKNEQIKLLDKDKQLAKQETLTYSLAFIIILILGSGWYIYKHLKNREKRLKLEAELKDSAYQIDLKNRELTHKAMTLSQQDQILSGIKEQLLNVDIENTRSKEAVLGVISNIDIQLNQSLMEDFEKYFIEVHPEFYNNLKYKYSELTQTELRICALIRLNLNSKEIARITQKSIRSIESTRAIIRKKMGLVKENLFDIIVSI